MTAKPSENHCDLLGLKTGLGGQRGVEAICCWKYSAESLGGGLQKSLDKPSELHIFLSK